MILASLMYHGVIHHGTNTCVNIIQTLSPITSSCSLSRLVVSTGLCCGVQLKTHFDHLRSFCQRLLDALLGIADMYLQVDFLAATLLVTPGIYRLAIS